MRINIKIVNYFLLNKKSKYDDQKRQKCSLELNNTNNENGYSLRKIIFSGYMRYLHYISIPLFLLLISLLLPYYIKGEGGGSQKLRLILLQVIHKFAIYHILNMLK